MMAYLVMMAARLVELHRVLKPTGSLYLHCDPYGKPLPESHLGYDFWSGEFYQRVDLETHIRSWQMLGKKRAALRTR